MLIVGNSIISDEIKNKHFCCNVEKCNGMCCVEGDAGAPITKEEITTIKTLLSEVMPYLPEKNQQTIKDHNFFTKDKDGDLVTQIIDGKDCVFAYPTTIVNCEGKEIQAHFCIFQKLYLEKKINFIKPISCHLYPIRISYYDEMSALNYHEWDICKSAIEEGRKQNIHIYENCKNALIRKFGQKWYDDLYLQCKKENNDNSF